MRYAVAQAIHFTTGNTDGLHAACVRLLCYQLQQERACCLYHPITPAAYSPAADPAWAPESTCI